MTNKPVNLDDHRGMAAQKDTEIRRDLREVQVDQAALRARREEFEALLLAAPAATWLEATAKARYLIELFAATPDAQDPRRQNLIASALADLTRLSDQNKDLFGARGSAPRSSIIPRYSGGVCGMIKAWLVPPVFIPIVILFMVAIYAAFRALGYS